MMLTSMIVPCVTLRPRDSRCLLERNFLSTDCQYNDANTFFDTSLPAGVGGERTPEFKAQIRRYGNAGRFMRTAVLA